MGLIEIVEEVLSELSRSGVEDRKEERNMSEVYAEEVNLEEDIRVVDCVAGSWSIVGKVPGLLRS